MLSLFMLFEIVADNILNIFFFFFFFLIYFYAPAIQRMVERAYSVTPVCPLHLSPALAICI